jgi:hypothetical protein
MGIYIMLAGLGSEEKRSLGDTLQVLQRSLRFLLGCSMCKQRFRNDLSGYVIANF